MFSQENVTWLCFSDTSISGCTVPSSNFMLPRYNLIVTGDLTLNSHIDHNSLVCGDVSASSNGEFSQKSNEVMPSMQNFSVEIQGKVKNGFKVLDGSLGVGCGERSISQDRQNTNIYLVDGQRVDIQDKGPGVNARQDCCINKKCDTVENNIQTLSDVFCSSAETPGNSHRSQPNTENRFDIQVNNVDANGIAILNISYAELFGSSRIREISFASTLKTLQLVVLNIHGTSIDTGNIGLVGFNPLPNGKPIASHWIWNFCDATSVIIRKQYFGAILAPKARVENPSAMDGTLAAKTVVIGNELHKPRLELPACLKT
jgi:choice-of-anchor A domain-containing protein